MRFWFKKKTSIFYWYFFYGLKISPPKKRACITGSNNWCVKR